MIIAAVVGVKDEVEMIRHTIKHLRAIGVDRIVVADYGSTDGTRRVLDNLSVAPDIEIVDIDPEIPVDLASWSDREVALAKGTHADWVVFQDADELWVPANGLIGGIAALTTADLIRVARYNVALTPEGPAMPVRLDVACHGELLLYVRRLPQFRQFMEENPSAAFIVGIPGRKIMARPRVLRSMELGHHDAQPSGGHDRVVDAHDVLIAHVPFTTFERFERKVANIRSELRVNPSLFVGDLAWHWRRWLTMADEGLLAREFERQLVTVDELARLRRAGVVRSAQDIFGDGPT